MENFKVIIKIKHLKNTCLRVAMFSFEKKILKFYFLYYKKTTSKIVRSSDVKIIKSQCCVQKIYLPCFIR